MKRHCEWNQEAPAIACHPCNVFCPRNPNSLPSLVGSMLMWEGCRLGSLPRPNTSLQATASQKDSLLPRIMFVMLACLLDHTDQLRPAAKQQRSST